MRQQQRPAIARRCPRPWTPVDERKLQSQLELLRADIRSAGGLEDWLQTRLPAWLEEAAGPCPVQVQHHRVPAGRV